MNKTLENALNAIIAEYTECHSKRALPDGIPAKFKNNCISAIGARMEVLDRKKQEDEAEYKECSFLMNALRNGWLVSDINTLRNLYDTVQALPDGPSKTKGQDLLDHIETTKTDTLVKRNEVVRYTGTYFSELEVPAAKNNPEEKERLKSTRLDLNNREVFPTEYPNDRNFTDNLGYDKNAAAYTFSNILKNNDKMLALEDEFSANLRSKENYIIGAVTEEEREAERNRPFEPNATQRWHNMQKSASQCISELVGNSVYDEIDEMTRGKAKDRKVPLKHASGTAYQKQGHTVIEMEFAGSSAHDVMKKHKGRNGKIQEDLSPEAYKELYGTKAKRRDGSEFDYIHFKEDPAKGEAGKKIKYTFAGATPDIPIIHGLINMGEYSIESCRSNARDFAKDVLFEQFEKWRLQGEKPKPINIMLSGISRGAVAAGQSAKKIDEWITDYIQTHPGSENFKDYVNYDLTMIDPVPGFITDFHMGHVTLDKIPNMNCTVFCSFGIVQPDLLFPLQKVNGAKKVILTVTDHGMDNDKVDSSQKGGIGNDRDHAMGYYDAETGEMYRGSGISKLPDGVYVADEKHNLIRVTSYSQMNELFKSVYGDTSPQRQRCQHIHNMVKDWFLKNDLEMSFPDEGTRKAETLKSYAVQNKLFRYNDPALTPIKTELQRLQAYKQEHASEAILKMQNENIMKACRDYMKDVTVPASGEKAAKMGLVSDILSYSMRERNYLNKEIGAKKNQNLESDLDKRIRTHKNKLENKEGYLDRKAELETKRLRKEQHLLNFVKSTAQVCKHSLSLLDETRKGKSNSKSYDRLHQVLEEGARMGTNTSPNDMMKFLKKLDKISDAYSASHNRVFGPLTDDGKTRLDVGNAMKVFGKETAKELEQTVNELGEKNLPIDVKVRIRESSVQSIREKQAQRENVVEIPAAPKQPEFAAAL